MNTIPTIFNEDIIPYTAVGGKERIASTGLSAVILNRPGYVRRSFFNDIEKIGFDNVISIESSSPHYDMEELSGRFPFVRFILPEHEINLGEQINLAAAETECPLFFVIRSDMKIIAGGIARRIAERMIYKNTDNDAAGGAKKNGIKRLCTVPVIMNSNYELFSSLSAPAVKKKELQSVFLDPQNEGDLTLYPFDGIGIYDTQRFRKIGGYDKNIKEKHWQLMDFGMRSYLYGEEIAINLHSKLSYTGELPVENNSIDHDYRRFYLKNLAPIFHAEKTSNQYASLPLYRFFSFLFNTGEDFYSAWKEFKEIRKWINKNKYRFICDARAVTDNWNTYQFRVNS